MLKKLDKFAVFSAVLFVTVFVFIYWLRPGGMYYQEAYQMFLWDSGYFAELMSMPGGLSSYIGEFLVQFYHIPLLGAMIIAGLIAIAAWLTGKVGKALYPDQELNILHAAPALMLFLAISDMEILHGFIVAVCMALLIAWLLTSAIGKHRTAGLAASAIGISLGYYLAGPAILIALVPVIWKMRQAGSGPISPIATIVILAITIAVCIRLVMYPIPKFFYGIEYYRYHQPSLMIIATVLATAILPIVRIPDKLTSGKIPNLIQGAICIAAIAIAPATYTWYHYKAACYLKWAHQEKWANITADAEVNKPNDRNSIILVNMALAFDKKLTSSMFHYRQMDPECLIPDFSSDMLTPALTAEAWFHMGLCNQAMRYYFESKEGNPTFRGSVHNALRLAECYIIDGDEVVAMKYLLQLRKTLFYKDIANQYIAQISQGTINQNPLIANIKKLRLKVDGRQDKDNIEVDFINMLKDNPQNHLAFEYLMGYLMLKKDLDGIMETVILGSKLGYSAIPIHVQEALIYAWYTKNNKSLQGLPPLISDDVKAKFNQKIITEDSYWRYLLSDQH